MPYWKCGIMPWKRMKGPWKGPPPSFPILELINHRLYDGLRDNPRFQVLLARQKQIYEERRAKFGNL